METKKFTAQEIFESEKFSLLEKWNIIVVLLRRKSFSSTRFYYETQLWEIEKNIVKSDEYSTLKRFLYKQGIATPKRRGIIFNFVYQNITSEIENFPELRESQWKEELFKVLPELIKATGDYLSFEEFCGMKELFEERNDFQKFLEEERFDYSLPHPLDKWEEYFFIFSDTLPEEESIDSVQEE